MKSNFISGREIKRTASKKLYSYLRKKKGIVNANTLCPLLFGASYERVLEIDEPEGLLETAWGVFLELFERSIIDEDGNIVKIPSFNEVKKCVLG